MAAPFARARAVMSLITAAMSLATVALQQTAMANIKPYLSRGHGRGNGHAAAVTAKWRVRSKYMPHQGKKERAAQSRGVSTHEPR